MSEPNIPFGMTLNPERGFTHLVYKKPACRTCHKPFETHVPNQKDCHACVKDRVAKRITRSKNMSKDAGREHVPAIGGKMYLRKHITDYWTSYQEIQLSRETPRSWVTGESWAETKYSKKEYAACSKQEYDDYRWLLQNRYKISKAIESCNSPAILRQVAALIGYKEESK